MKIRWSLLIFVLTSIVGSSRAQDNLQDTLAHRLQDGPAILATFGGDVEKAAIGFGYQVAYRHNATWSLEFAAFRQTDESVELGNRAPSVPPDTAIDLTLWGFSLTAHAGYNPFEQVRAYAGAGAGVYRLDPSNEQLRETSGANAAFIEAETATDFGWHLVGGLAWAFHRHWHLFGEYRIVFYETELDIRFAPSREALTQDSTDDFDYDHMVFRVGINYLF